MNKKDFLLTILLTGIVLLIAGCAKDFSTAVNKTYSNVTVGYVRDIPSSEWIIDSPVLLIAKATSPKLVSSLRVDIYNNGNFLISVLLYDNGNTANGDALIGDSLFSGLLRPKSNFPNGSYTFEYILTPVDDNSFICAIQYVTFSNGINSRPAISDVQAPDTLTVTDNITPFTMSVKVSDIDGLTDISRVYYSVTRPDGTSNGTQFEMKDNGISPDAIENDGIYTAISGVYPNSPLGTYGFEFHAKDKSGAYSNSIIHKITLK